ncbi:MAG: 50S ribosomal protein L29 [Lentisphaeria bacterium]
MKASDIREMTEQELAKNLEDALKKQLTMNLQQATGQLADTAQMKKVRRDIARMKTEINSRAKTA